MAAPGNNFRLATQEVSWLQRDLLLFAVSIGVTTDELNFVFEQNDVFQAFPTYPTILPFKLTDQEVVDFNSRLAPPEIPGVPKLDSGRIIDGGRSLTFHRQIPTTSAGRHFKLQSRIVGVYDKGKIGTVVEDEKILVDCESGDEYVKILGTTFYMGQGNWNGPKGPAPKSYPPPEGRKPDVTYTYQTTSQAALIYRLNGDYNRLHVTQEPGKSLGFGGPIMHGLFTYNCAAHAILKAVGASNPANLREFTARFAVPVRPGDQLITEIWRLGEFEGEYEDVRLDSILGHIQPPSSGLPALLRKDADDIVITLALRTALGKGFKGGFKDTEFASIVYRLLKVVHKKAGFNTSLVEDICVGNVLDFIDLQLMNIALRSANSLQVANEMAAHVTRAAALAAGFSESAGTSSVNRFCSSGLKAVQEVANQISRGSIDIGIAIGAESMSRGGATIPNLPSEICKVQSAADTLQPMGQTSENVGNDFNISREAQDRYAAESFRRAEAAQKAGWFDDEIVPITAQFQDPKTGEFHEVTLTKDEGPRWGTTFDSLSKIRPAFPEFGDKSTGGNSSQITDGAAAVILMRRSKAEQLKLPIMGKFCGATVTGVAPRIMGIGPSIAIPKLLRKFNINLNDIDLIELNEAFASMAVYCHNVLGLDPSKVNVRGGAIALGHPLGATGVRQIVTGLSEARRQNKKVLLTTMCVGTGQGMAALFINEQAY
ncbi:hypothetical protein B7463_g7927, partial [Scytalidium lignicola]